MLSWDQTGRDGSFQVTRVLTKNDFLLSEWIVIKIVIVIVMAVDEKVKEERRRKE